MKKKKNVQAISFTGAVVTFAHEFVRRSFTKGDVLILNEATASDWHGRCSIELAVVLEQPSPDHIEKTLPLMRIDSATPIDCCVYVALAAINAGRSAPMFRETIVDGRRWRKASDEEMLAIDAAVAESIRKTKEATAAIADVVPVRLNDQISAWADQAT